MSKEIKKVLVIKLGALGDFVLALAAMKKIREAHPRAKITLLTTPPFEALAKLSPYFNTVETDGRPSDFGDLTALLGRLRKARYDRVYDLQTNSRTNWYFQALRPFAPQWSGIAAGCSLPQRGKARYHMHTLERHADQLKQAGIWPDAPAEPGGAWRRTCRGFCAASRSRARWPAPPPRVPTCCWCPAARPTGPKSAGRSRATRSSRRC